MQAQTLSPALRAPACATRRSARRMAQPGRASAVEEVLTAGSKGTDVPPGLNKYSSRITQPKSQGASQAMLYGTGLTEADMNKPQVRWAGMRRAAPATACGLAAG
jgi:dihydroxy-acid dehydratase